MYFNQCMKWSGILFYALCIMFHPAHHLIKTCELVCNAGREMYRQPGLLCTPQNLAPSSKFLGKKYFLVLRLPLRHSQAVPKIWRSHDFRDAQKRNFEPVDETLVFQGHLIVFWGSFMASLCSSRWSNRKCCKTECVAFKTSFQTRPMWAL
jgi:hypothetical protein